MFIVAIWSSLLMIYWRRKNAEISTRWGVFDLMKKSNSISKDRKIRPEFTGFEIIKESTGEITYLKPKRRIGWLLKLFSLLVIFVFFVIYFSVFYLT